jgi:preprotein translocase subunit YajC
MFNRKILMIGAALALPAAPAFAQTVTPGTPAANSPPAGTAQAAPNVAVGATVYDSKGGTVGTVASADTSAAVVDTGTNKVKLPLASFAASQNGPVIAMTKAELDAAAASAAKPLALNVGATVYGPQGGVVGKIEAVDAEFVTVATAKTKAKLPKKAFAMGETGPVIGMTAEQLDAAAGAASASSTPASPANPS